MHPIVAPVTAREPSARRAARGFAAISALRPAALGAALGLVTLAACGPRVAPMGPGTDPAGDLPPAMAASAPAAAGAPPAHEMLVGELCPEAASGRPAVLPMFARTLTWSANAEDVTLPIERRSARQFSVLSWDGRRAGVFSVAGAADVGLDRKAAIGAYAGTSPCSKPPRAGAGAEPAADATCVEARAHCGLALAVLEPGGAAMFEEDPEPVPLALGGACTDQEHLIVDIDGDGAIEAFPIAAFLSPVREPAEEVLAVSAPAAACTPTFSSRHILPPADPRHWRGLDLLGVVDIDGDGRKELILAYHYQEGTTWAVYSAISTTARLDLVGEAVPWPNR